MKTATHTANFDAPCANVFAYLADMENLPEWATGFCKSMRKEGDDYFVQTPQCEVYFRIDHDEKTGVLDMTSGPTKAMTATWPVRVARLPDDSTLLTFTAIQMPGMTDEMFAEQCAELEREFENIRAAVEQRSDQ